MSVKKHMRSKSMKFGKIGRLPRRPSLLITLALKDLERSERSKIQKIDMSTWMDVNPFEEGKQRCAVCLAGAVMMNSLDAKKRGLHKTGAHPDDFSNEMHALRALNSFRTGNVYEAFAYLGIDIHRPFRYRYIAHYHTDKKQFKADMRQLAKDLKKEGF